MPVSEEDLVRFKHAFLGTLAARETPLLAHRIQLPDAVRGNQRVLDVLGSLDDELDESVDDANSKRTGKKVLGITWTKDKNSSLKKTADSIGDTVDLDALANITKGKGKVAAQQALAKAKLVEKQLQQAIAEELLEQAKNEVDLTDETARVTEAVNFLQQPGVDVDGGKDKAVLGVASVLAKKLGMGANALLGSSAAEIKAAYLDGVYAPLKMENKAARDPGVLKTIHELVGKLDAFDVATLTPDGAAATFLTQLKAAGLSNTVMMNTARAGKFAVGDPADKAISIDSETGEDPCKLNVKGNKRFVDALSGAIDKIGDTDAGKLLFEAIAATKLEVQITAPSVSSAQRVGQDGNTYYSNSADKGKVALDPENDIAGEDATDDKIESEKWRKRDASVALYHEMIHALIGNKGGEEWESQNKNATIKLSQVGDITELRIVGIDYRDKDGNLFPFSDPHYNPISENNYRRALAKQNGETEVYLRPFYANVAGQVKLSGDKVPV